MTLDQIVNFGKVTVSTGYAAGATSIVLITDDGAKLPDPASGQYNLVYFDGTGWGDPAEDPLKEIVRVTGKTVDTLTVVRAQEGTSDSNKNTALHTYKMILAFTKVTYDAIKTTVDATTGTNTGDNTIATAEVVTDTASATTWPALYETATGSIAIHTDAGLTYNATTAALSTTTFVGALTGAASSNVLKAGDTMTGDLGYSNAAARSFVIANSATDVAGKALTVASGGTIAGTSVDNVAGGNLIIQAGLGTGTAASTISFQNGTTLTTGKTLQTMSTKMTILGSGNVGIGTTNPGCKFHIESAGGDPTTSTNLGLRVRSTTTTADQGTGINLFTGSGAVEAGWSIAIAREGATNYGYLDFLAYDGGTVYESRVRILNNGNVGIGTTSPSTPLDVRGVTGIINLQSTTGTNTTYQKFTNTGGIVYVGKQGSVGNEILSSGGIAYSVVIDSGSTDPIQFGVADVAKMTILNSGNVGIGQVPSGTSILELLLTGVPAAANNSAAASAGVVVGGFYRTNADPSVLCIRSV